MPEDDLSKTTEPNKATGTATPPDSTAAGVETKKDLSPTNPTEQEEQELSDADILSELENVAPEKTVEEKAIKDEESEASRKAREASRDLKVLAASRRVQKAFDSGEELEDAISNEKTNLQGSIRKLLNGEDLRPDEPQPQQNVGEVARSEFAKFQDEQDFKKEFKRIVKEQGINTTTTTSITQRKQLKELSNRISSDSVSRTEALQFVAAKLFNKNPKILKGVAAGTISPNSKKKGLNEKDALDELPDQL